MKYLFLVVFTFNFYLVSAQISFNSGNVQLDSDLNIINTQARSDLSSFRKDLILSYNVSEKKLDYMGVNLGMVPGDMYLSLEISRIARVPLDDVLIVYRKHKAKGWGVIAKQLGIKPGSAEFHQLKNRASSKKGKSQVKKPKKQVKANT
ncbi:hypothetical protein [Confluentibacter citreus]|uniref:hypothetical protein n=1 Tax=Confluentibacter citreus TaxID=2007307 RepID=UPI000C28636B|nr:hypothetical protein [Confluentibacter citreus]